MKLKFEWDEDQVYVGFYKGKPYCICEYEEFIDRYMRSHRKCDNYEVEVYDNDSLFVIARPELYLYEFNGLYVTERDIVMSKLFMEDMPSMLKNTYRNLYEISRIMGQTKKGQKMINDFIKAMKTLDKISNDSEFVNEIQSISEIDNPFIYSDMNEYIKYVNRYEEYMNSKDYWDSYA